MISRITSTENNFNHSMLPLIAVPPYADTHRHQHLINLLPFDLQFSEGAELVEDPVGQCRQIVIGESPCRFVGGDTGRGDGREVLPADQLFGVSHHTVRW